MASTGMQFTEQELNIMYQQQMVAQQAYKQWVATLSLDQQGQLHARMQANMQQVQQGMAAMMQNILKTSAEASNLIVLHDMKTSKPFARKLTFKGNDTWLIAILCKWSVNFHAISLVPC